MLLNLVVPEISWEVFFGLKTTIPLSLPQSFWLEITMGTSIVTVGFTDSPQGHQPGKRNFSSVFIYLNFILFDSFVLNMSLLALHTLSPPLSPRSTPPSVPFRKEPASQGYKDLESLFRPVFLLGEVILFNWACSFWRDSGRAVREEGDTHLASQVSLTSPGDQWGYRCSPRSLGYNQTWLEKKISQCNNA